MEIMKFSRDKAELMALAECVERTGKSSQKFLSRFTMYTGEKFLDDRGTFINEEIENDSKFKEKIKIVSAACDDKKCSKCLVCKYCNYYINEKRAKVNAKSLKMVDLFCGAGGLSLGFTQEGFVTSLANDIEECCVDTYAHNHPETPRDHIIKGDIRLVNKNLKTLLDGQKIDVVVGGPPCQSFSFANRQRIIDDPRNFLYKAYVDIVRDVRPKFFIMENVKGMLGVANQVKEDFQTIGYDVCYHILDASEYGVPQHRERLIYIGNRIGIDNEKVFDEIHQLSKNISHTVLDDAIFALRPLKANRIKNDTENGTTESGHIIEKKLITDTNNYIKFINQGREIPVVFNHKARYNNARDIEIYRRMNPGDNSLVPQIADIMPYSRRNGIFKDKYYKLEPNRICKTITAHMKFDCNMYIHPSQARGLTPREAARIQSYPDDYFFRGPYTKTYMQIGNSVPPLLGRAIASIVKKYI